MKDRNRQRNFEGMFIPAFLLIGIGIGLLFGRPDVGALTGLGAGFIAMGIAKIIKSPGPGLSSALGRSFFPIFIGVVFILAGLGLVYFPGFIWPYVGALVLIVLGVWILFRAATPHEEEKPDENQ
jgi:Ca2+/Na+ antiporter